MGCIQVGGTTPVSSVYPFFPPWLEDELPLGEIFSAPAFFFSPPWRLASPLDLHELTSAGFVGFSSSGGTFSQVTAEFLQGTPFLNFPPTPPNFAVAGFPSYSCSFLNSTKTLRPIFLL